MTPGEALGGVSGPIPSRHSPTSASIAAADSKLLTQLAGSIKTCLGPIETLANFASSATLLWHWAE